MSKIEEHITSELSNHNVDFEVQVPVPLENYPWKTERTKTPPKPRSFGFAIRKHIL